MADKYIVPSTVVQHKFMMGTNKLRKKKGINKTALLLALQDYYDNVVEVMYPFKTNKVSLSRLKDGILNDFSGFLFYLTKHSGVTFTKRKYRTTSYDKYWEESNMDGSFAYNGVTDDF